MKIIAIVGSKGGAGKSTIAINLAAVLPPRDHVVVLDADIQQSALGWAARGDLPFQVLPIEDELHAFRRTLNEVDAEVAVIDCPPSAGDATALALAVADVALIPVRASGVDLEHLGTTLHDCWVAQGARGRSKRPHILLIPSQVRRTRLVQDLVPALKKLGEEVAPGISLRVDLERAAMTGHTVADFKPDHPSLIEFKRLARTVRRQLL